MKFSFFKRTLPEPASERPKKPRNQSKATQAIPSGSEDNCPAEAKYERLPMVCILLYGLGLLSLVLYVVMSRSVAFADWFNTTVSSFLRTVFAAVTYPLPFSLGEAVIWLLPLALVLVLRHAVHHRCGSWKAAAAYIGILLSVVVTLFSVFVWNFAAGYRGRSLDEKLELERTEVSAEELYDTAVLLIEAINRETDDVHFQKDGFSEMPYSLEDMNDKLGKAYGRLADEYTFIPTMPARVKPVLASEVMSYMHITGVYSFFTGEANLNVNFPDYTLPYTAAHELAHQRGIAREDEANFVAFLVCSSSDDPYIRYCGYLNLYEYVASALWQADRDRYYMAVAKFNSEVIAEMNAYNRFYDQYRHSTVSQVSGSINNSYLQSQGTVGTKSYGMVVDLAVSYFKVQQPEMFH